MPKQSQLPPDSSPQATDKLTGVTGGGSPTAVGYLLSTLANFFWSLVNIPAGGTSPITRGSETFTNFVASGLIWSADAPGSTRNASMTAGVVYINGLRIPIAAVSAVSFAASSDTYVDVLSNGDGTGTLVYTPVSNNATSSNLAANSVRISTIVTNASSIAASTSIGQGGFANTVPVISSQVLKGFDSIGNLIYPKGSMSKNQISCKFSVRRANSQTPSGGVIQYDTKDFDTGNNVDVTTNKGRFTAPIAGFYQLNVVSDQTVTTAPNDAQVTLRQNGATTIGFGHFVNMYNGASSGSANVSVLVQLAANDYVEVLGPTVLSLVVAVGHQTFSGYLVAVS